MVFASKDSQHDPILAFLQLLEILLKTNNPNAYINGYTFFKSIK